MTQVTASATNLLIIIVVSKLINFFREIQKSPSF